MKKYLILFSLLFLNTAYANSEIRCDAENPSCITYENLIHSSEIISHNLSQEDIRGTITVECKNNFGETAVDTRSMFSEAGHREVVKSNFFLKYLLDCSALLSNGTFSKILSINLDDDADHNKSKNLIYLIK